MSNINYNSAAVTDFCRRNLIKRLAFFGSVIRDDFRPDSDVDILVEFLPEARVGFLGMARLENELTAIIGRKVDLRTPAELSRYFVDEVLEQAEVQYAEA